MTRRQRAWHWTMWWVIEPLIVVGLILALWARSGGTP
jgi:hypothetical protein